MSVRCKVQCVRTSQSKYGYGQNEKPQYEAEFSAVSGGSPENSNFFKYTPSCSIKTGILTQQFFEVGKEYYLDFTEAVNAD